MSNTIFINTDVIVTLLNFIVIQVKNSMITFKNWEEECIEKDPNHTPPLALFS